MTRSYHLEIAALATNCQPKWIDNLLSHHPVPGVSASKQGVARRITPDGLLHIRLVRVLVDDLEVTTAHALRLATSILASPDSTAQLASGTIIHIDAALLRGQLETALLDLAGVVVPRRRGRPPLRAESQSDD